MISLTLKRIECTTIATRGVLLLNGNLIACTLEDVVRAKKIVGITAIRHGKYDVVVSHSPRFDRPLPLLLDVPEFSGVRIHTGNTTADTEGCILVGDSFNFDSLTTINSSRPAFARLFESIKHCTARGMATITITNH